MSPSSKPPFQYGLFLSYDHSDLELAKSVYARLSERLPVWWDNRSLSVGHSFPRKIEQAMEQSAAVLFLITANSARSLAQTTTWMRRELDMASVLETEREPPLQLMALRFGKVDMPLGLMRYTYKDCPGPDILDEVIDEIIASVQTPVQLRDTPQNGSAPSGTSLAQILSGATRSLTISGHTLDKICEAADVRRALNALIEKDVRVTLILLNPDCAYASAHEPFHLAESRTSAAQEIKSALHSLRSIFEYAGRSRNLEVFLSNYMPRFRTIILDDEVIYVHLYLYGHNVPAKHDFYLRRTEPDPQKALLFGAIVESTAQLLHSPDVIPYIRDGTLCERWTERHESTSFNWPPERRQRYQTIQHFYRDKCVDFHTKHGEDMEVYVQDFLKKTGEAALALDRTVLVLGCGTGKELSYLHKRGCEPWGVDFCSET
ncbi:MAG TPA: TIR domain-containing protein, partial [Prosthecobacter sp.]|nr:TIR domain-containing protein [Prosthecobacter sp.]